jgi:hypothetical protein
LISSKIATGSAFGGKKSMAFITATTPGSYRVDRPTGHGRLTIDLVDRLKPSYHSMRFIMDPINWTVKRPKIKS